MIVVGAKLEERNKNVLAMINGQVFAIDAVCSHKGAPLVQGKLEGYELTFTSNYAVFGVHNEKVSDRTVWARNQTSYPVKVDDDIGYILINANPGIRQKGGKEAAGDTST